MTDAPFGLMKLYYSPGASSLAPHIALREAGRVFDIERVDLRAHRTASGTDYLTINPKGDVPALQLDGPQSLVLTENAAILQYIADLVPDTGLAPPSGTFSRYHLQEWLAFIGTEIEKPFTALFQPDTPALTQERARGRIGERFVYISGVLVDRAHLMGETFTVADCYLFSVLRWCERFGLDLHLWPNLDEYFLRISERPSVHGALASEGLIEARRYRRTA
jgi:glutathione S-transferase